MTKTHLDVQRATEAGAAKGQMPASVELKIPGLPRCKTFILIPTNIDWSDKTERDAALEELTTKAVEAFRSLLANREQRRSKALVQ